MSSGLPYDLPGVLAIQSRASPRLPTSDLRPRGMFAIVLLLIGQA